MQGAADLVALRQRRGIVDTVQVQQQSADRVGRTAAVVQQFGPVGVAVAGFSVTHVLCESTQQVGQQRNRQAIGADGLAQGDEDARPACAAGQPVGHSQQVAEIGVQILQALHGRRITLIGDVVGRSGEPVDRLNGRTQPRRAEPGGNGEVFVVFNRHGDGKKGGCGGIRAPADVSGSAVGAASWDKKVI